MIRFMWRGAPEPDRPRVGVALGGGGSKGFAHLGVLRALREEGLSIDAIAGTSVGAIVGALFAAGFDVNEIQQGMHGADRILRRWTLSRLSVWSDSGLRELLDQAGADLSFDDLTIPFAAVATDLSAGDCVVLDQGPLWTAVQASCAIPGVFPPVIVEGHYLADGGISCPVPVQAVRELGVDFVVAVDLGEAPGRGSLTGTWPARGRPHLMGLLGRAREVQRWQLHRLSLRGADVIIRPGLARWHWKDFSRHGEAYAQAGEAAARRMAPEIRRLLTAPGFGPMPSPLCEPA